LIVKPVPSLLRTIFASLFSLSESFPGLLNVSYEFLLKNENSVMLRFVY
jgi:hypothetical protein